MEDRDIVALYLRRDETAVKYTAEKYGSRLRGLALGITIDRMGMDVKECGFLLAMVYELYECGILSREELDGLEMNWGNCDAGIELVKRIARRQGDCLCIGEEFFLPGSFAGYFILRYAGSPHQSPFIVIACQPHFTNVIKGFILPNFFRR